MKKAAHAIFAERYRVVAVHSDRLLLRGVHSGEVLTVMNPEPGVPICVQDYPAGKFNRSHGSIHRAAELAITRFRILTDQNAALRAQ